MDQSNCDQVIIHWFVMETGFFCGKIFEKDNIEREYRKSARPAGTSVNTAGKIPNTHFGYQPLLNL